MVQIGPAGSAGQRGEIEWSIGLFFRSFFTFHLVPPKPQILGPFSDIEKLQLKMLNNGDAHLQTTLNRHRSPTKVA